MKAAVLEAYGQPLNVTDVDLHDPQPPIRAPVGDSEDLAGPRSVQLTLGPGAWIQHHQVVGGGFGAPVEVVEHNPTILGCGRPGAFRIAQPRQGRQRSGREALDRVGEARTPIRIGNRQVGLASPDAADPLGRRQTVQKQARGEDALVEITGRAALPGEEEHAAFDPGRCGLSHEQLTLGLAAAGDRYGRDHEYETETLPSHVSGNRRDSSSDA